MKKVILPFLLAASAACAGVVAITGDDGTTRILDVPAQGTNWCGIVGVTSSRTIVTNMEALARREATRANAGTIAWADGTRSHFRLPKEGKTVAVSHEIKVLGKNSRRTRLVEVLWINHEGKTVSNAIGRASKVLPYRPQFDKARKDREDKALAAAKRRPNPDPEDFRYVNPHRRLRRGRPVANGKPRPKPAPKKREEPEEDVDKILDEYRDKAEKEPSTVILPGRDAGPFPLRMD